MIDLRAGGRRYAQGTVKIYTDNVLPFVIFFLLAGPETAASPDPPRKPLTEMQQAVQEFERQTRVLGMRPDSEHSQVKLKGPRPAWHGRVFENIRNDAFDAIPHEVRQRGKQNSLLRRNQFGFNVGGPLLLPHFIRKSSGIFFSVSYEGVRERISRTYLQTIPTVTQRTGDFSATVDQAGNRLAIFDPAGTRPNPQFDAARPVSSGNLQYLRDQFPEGRIPASRLDKVAQAAVALYPRPNAAVGPFLQNNYFINSPETNIANGLIAKVDAPVGTRHRVSLEIDNSNGLLGAPRWFASEANPGAADRNFRNPVATVHDTWTVSPNTVNNAGFQARSSVAVSGADQAVFPNYTIASYLGLGRAYPASTAANNVYDWSDGIATRQGKHALRFSGGFTAYQVNVSLPQYPAGYFRFTSGITSLPGITNTGDSFAGFLLGLPEYAERSVVTSPSYFRRASALVSAGDTWSVAKGVTLSFGLGATLRTPRVEKYDRQSTVDLGRRALVIAGRNGVARGIRPTSRSIDPSIGVAWNPLNRSDTVVRAGYSRTHSAIPIYGNQWGTQAFNARQTFLSPNVQLQPALLLRGGIPSLEAPLPNLDPHAADGSIADLTNTSGRLPAVQSASLSIERQLPKSFLIAISYGHSDGHDLLLGNGAVNPNAIPADALRYRDLLNVESFNASLRPYPQYKGFDVNSSWPLGRYQRDAGTVRLEKRASGGLSLNLAYTFSKQMDDYSGPYGTQDFYNRNNEWSLTSWNTPQTVQLSYVYELPLGANRGFLTYSDWRRYLVEGWAVSGDVYLGAGTPLALRPEFNNTGGVISALNVNLVPNVDPHAASQGPAQWFNPAAFDQPADFSLGDASRTLSNLSNPAVHAFDVNISKRIPLNSETTIEFNVAAFDVLNHADWNQPDTTIGPASAPNVNAGRIIGSHGGRVIQLGARFSF
jgi:hypothetical protein